MLILFIKHMPLITPMVILKRLQTLNKKCSIKHYNKKDLKFKNSIKLKLKVSRMEREGVKCAQGGGGLFSTPLAIF